MVKLWQKNKEKINKTVEDFETGDDLLLDAHLIKVDIYGSMAHAQMLSKIGILNDEEFKKIKKNLVKILLLEKKGKVDLKPGDEDVHTKIENLLTFYTNGVGKKINTGRSRNDQVVLDLRLYTKEKLLRIWGKTLGLANVLNDLSFLYNDIPMPGYTHMQKAMPSSVGMWFGSYAESMLDNIELIKTSYKLNNQSPLGSAAGYGTTLPLDRKIVAEMLGFEKVQNNSLYCQNSRGKIESITLFALSQIVFDISKLASDVILFTTSEFNFFNVDPQLCTGSSIMPQKKNVDIAELLRSKTHVMQGYLSQVIGITSNLPSGYNRDFQDTKKPYMEAFLLTEKVIDVTDILIKKIKPNKEILLKSMTGDLYTTYEAYRLVLEGIPFRDAYREIGQNVDSFLQKEYDAMKMLSESKHVGGTGNLNQEKLNEKIQGLKDEQKKEFARYNKAIKDLLD